MLWHYDLSTILDTCHSRWVFNSIWSSHYFIFLVYVQVVTACQILEFVPEFSSTCRYLLEIQINLNKPLIIHQPTVSLSDIFLLTPVNQFFWFLIYRWSSQFNYSTCKHSLLILVALLCLYKKEKTSLNVPYPDCYSILNLKRALYCISTAQISFDLEILRCMKIKIKLC